MKAAYKIFVWKPEGSGRECNIIMYLEKQGGKLWTEFI
jgi:hypothetical protein